MLNISHNFGQAHIQWQKARVWLADGSKGGIKLTSFRLKNHVKIAEVGDYDQSLRALESPPVGICSAF